MDLASSKRSGNLNSWVDQKTHRNKTLKLSGKELIRGVKMNAGIGLDGFRSFQMELVEDMENSVKGTVSTTFHTGILGC